MVHSFMTFLVCCRNVAISICAHICCRNGTVCVCPVEMWPDILYMLYKSVVTYFLEQVFFLIPWTNWNRLSVLTMD